MAIKPAAIACQVKDTATALSMDRIWIERLRLLTSPFRMLPSFIIPGETKCGTTTFFRCLEQHPLIVSPDVKEPNNFIRYGGTSIFCRMHYPLILRKLLNPRLITGEASVEYLSKKHTPHAIHSLLPEVKLIIMLRNPVTRALSDFLMMKDSGREPEDFDSVIRNTVAWLSDGSLERLVKIAASIDLAPLRYVTKGCYVNTVTPWLERFPREHIKIIKSERFFLEPHKVLDVTFDFLGLPRIVVKDVPHHRKARRTVPVRRETVQLLHQFFSPYNQQLRDLLGDEFNWDEETETFLESCKA